MLQRIDEFYLKQKEPLKSTYLALKEIICSLDASITNDLKYGMPFFMYKGKMFCYLWADKKTNEPYIGMVEGELLKHPLLEKGKRKRMAIFTLQNNKDLPIDTIHEILNDALELYRKGIVKVK